LSKNQHRQDGAASKSALAQALAIAPDSDLLLRWKEVGIERDSFFLRPEKFRRYSEISLAFEYFHVLMSVHDSVAPCKQVAAPMSLRVD
jgi:hypothetical protein